MSSSFAESNLFQQLFKEIVDRCQEAGLVEGEHLSVDGGFLTANASLLSRIPREQLVEAAHLKRIDHDDKNKIARLV